MQDSKIVVESNMSTDEFQSTHLALQVVVVPDHLFSTSANKVPFVEIEYLLLLFLFFNCFSSLFCVEQLSLVHHLELEVLRLNLILEHSWCAVELDEIET